MVSHHSDTLAIVKILSEWIMWGLYRVFAKGPLGFLEEGVSTMAHIARGEPEI